MEPFPLAAQIKLAISYILGALGTIGSVSSQLDEIMPNK